MAKHLSLFALSLAAAFKTVTAVSFPPPTGPYNTTLLTTSLTDTTRLDPFAPTNTSRSIMISIFSPTTPGSCISTLTPYMDLSTASIQDAKLTAFGLPDGLFETLTLQTCTLNANTKQHGKHRTQPKSGNFPVLLFSPAAATSRLLYSALAQQVASHGYTVITLDHPYDADVVVFPDNTTIYGLDIPDDSIPLFVSTRAQDLSFVLDQLALPATARKLFPGSGKCGVNVSKVGVFGHSLGGAAAAEAMLLDARFVGGVNLDGSMFGSVVSAGLNRPFMLFAHEGKNLSTDATWEAIWPKLTAWKALLGLEGSAHYTFSDLASALGVLGYGDLVAAVAGDLLGTIEGGRALTVVVEFVGAFFGMVLMGQGVGILGGESKAFPEVGFVEV